MEIQNDVLALYCDDDRNCKTVFLENHELVKQSLEQDGYTDAIAKLSDTSFLILSFLSPRIPNISDIPLLLSSRNRLQFQRSAYGLHWMFLRSFVTVSRIGGRIAREGGQPCE